MEIDITSTTATTSNEAEDPQNEISSSIKFSTISTLMEKLRKANPIARKCEILQTFINSFKKYRNEYLNKLQATDCNASFYPVLRLLLPNEDRERDSYGIKTFTMGKLYVRILAIDPHGSVARRLTTLNTNEESLDFADIVYDVMKLRCQTTGNLTVFQVNKHLNTIAEYNHNNKRNKIDEELIKMINGMSAIDQKWLIRIMLKKLHLGIGTNRILNTYDANAYEFYRQYSNLSRVCESVENAVTITLNDKIEPFEPIRPMLCERIDVTKLQSMLNKREYNLETKMDGERFHIHVKDERYKYYSRRGYDYTNVFGSNVNEGTLTPFVHKLFKIRVESAIFDGEMMVYNKEENIYHTKGENYDVKSLRKEDSTLRPSFCVYDVLYLNGSVLADKPYGERRRLLLTLIKEQEGFLTICKSVRIVSGEDILNHLNKAIDDREEGVVIKDVESTYKPGERNGGWCKIKPDYIDGLVTDFDLIIIGGYFNRRKTYIESYIMGVFKKDSDKADSGTFYSVAHVSLGLNYETRRNLDRQLQAKRKPVITNKLGRKTIAVNTESIEWGSVVPDVWFEPKDSIILEVKAAELVTTSTFRTAYTLRFPRIVNVRSDKLWYECCTLDEFSKFCESKSKVEKITKRHVTSDDINGPQLNKERLSKRLRLKNSVKLISSSIWCESKTESSNAIETIDNICDGLDFCILSTGKNKPTINELKQMVLRHGGRIVENPSSKTFVCIAENQSLKVKSLIDTKTYNIATVDWLIKALAGTEKRDKLNDFHPHEMLSKNEMTERVFIDKFDQYGDSYTERFQNIDELKSFFKKMDNYELDDCYFVLCDIEKQLYRNQCPNFFRSYVAYFNPADAVEPMFKLSKYLFMKRAGIVHESVDKNNSNRIQYVIVNPKTVSKQQFMHDLNKLFGGSKRLAFIQIISYEWIHECDQQDRVVSFEKFLINI